MHHLNLFKSSVVAVLLLMSSLSQGEVVVVVGANSSVSSLTAEQVSQLFLGKASSFPSGGQAVPIDQPEDSAARDEFHNKITNKAPAQLNAYWSKLIFSGKGQPPKQADAAEIKTLLAGDAKLISYLDRSQVDGSVKIVLAP